MEAIHKNSLTHEGLKTDKMIMMAINVMPQMSIITNVNGIFLDI